MENGRYDAYPFEVYTYDVVDSTNAAARRALAMMGESVDRSVHVAGEQTEGKGRRGRSWLNTEDAVMMSIVQSTKLSMDRIPMLNLAAAAAVRNAMLKMTGRAVDLSIKWPNDVVTTERLEKVCGILSEVVRIEGKKFAVIGIGLNLNADHLPDDLLQPATSIYMQYGKYIGVLDAVNEILKEFLVQYKLLMSDAEAFCKNFVQNCISIDRHLAVIEENRVRYGVGDRLAPNGQLLVRYEDGVSDVVYAADVSVISQKEIDDQLAAKLMPRRRPGSNKGDHGRALIIAGSPGMPGAALMCTGACIRSGAGLTKALIPAEIMPSFAVIPEAMLSTDDGEAGRLIEWAGVIAIGPGMGVSERTRALVKTALSSGKPCVADADALNTIAEYPELMELLHEKVLITPHPGEMARLLGSDVDTVRKNFSASAISFAKQHKCGVLLKSASSIIVSSSGAVRYNDRGSSALAKGGSGDVLTGVIAAMAAQGAKLFDAASLGAYLLGISGEKAVYTLHNRFARATDMIDIIASELGAEKDGIPDGNSV